MIKAIENRVEPRLESFQRQALPKGNSTVSFGASEMNKEMSQAQMNNFQAIQRINKSKDISFMGSDTKSLGYYLYDSRAGKAETKKYIEDNKDSYHVRREGFTFDYLDVHTDFARMESFTSFFNEGVIYITQDGKLERHPYLSQELKEEIYAKEGSEGIFEKGLFLPLEAAQFFIEKGQLDAVINAYTTGKFNDSFEDIENHDKEAEKAKGGRNMPPRELPTELRENRNREKVEETLARALVLEDRLTDALEIFPGQKEAIAEEVQKIGRLEESIGALEDTPTARHALIEEYGYEEAKKKCPSIVPGDASFDALIEAGMLKEAGEVYKDKKQVLDFIVENLDIEEWAEAQRKNAKEGAENRFSYLHREGFDRAVIAAITLGISEIQRAYKKNAAKDEAVAEKNQDIGITREQVAEVLARQLELQEKRAERKYKQSLKLRSLEEKKSEAKEVLLNELILQINLANKGRSYDLPNCVMLVGENPYVTKELIDWTGQHAAADYVIVPNNLNRNELQKDLVATLKSAEANYQKTGKRTVIYVENMEKLLNPQTNPKKNIAAMKDFMTSAEEDYHSTIIFQTKDPDKLDPGTTVSHRVGLRVDVPVSFDDANLLKV